MNPCIPPFCNPTQQAPDAQGQITGAIDALVKMGVAIGLSYCAFMLVLAGYKYMSARGNPLLMERAKGALEHAGIGFGIVLMATVLSSLVKSVLHV